MLWRLQVLGWCICVAWLAAFAAARFLGAPAVVVFLAVTGALFIGEYLLERWWEPQLDAASNRIGAIFEQCRNEATLLTLDEARRAALEAFRDPDRFLATPLEEGAPPLPAELGPALQELFGSYQSVVFSDAHLSRALVGPSLVKPGYIRIGSDGEHSEAAVLPGEDTVYILADDVDEAEAEQERLPSVYHYLLYSDCVDRRVRE